MAKKKEQIIKNLHIGGGQNLPGLEIVGDMPIAPGVRIIVNTGPHPIGAGFVINAHKVKRIPRKSPKSDKAQQEKHIYYVTIKEK